MGREYHSFLGRLLAAPTGFLKTTLEMRADSCAPVSYTHLVSVDGYRLAIREEPVQSAEETNFVVPGKTLSEVTKLLSDSEEDTLSLLVGRRHILFKIGKYTVISRLLEGEHVLSLIHI